MYYNKITEYKIELFLYFVLFFSGKGAFGNVYTCRKTFAGYKKKYAAKIVEFGEDNKIKWQTENEIEVFCYCMLCSNNTIFIDGGD